MTADHVVRVEGTAAVPEIVLNRPDKLNALNEEMLLALEDVLDQLDGDRSVRVLIVRGEGRAFCAGADLDVAGDRISDPTLLPAHAAHWRRVFGRLASSPVPSIAAVHGVAVAGGFELTLACDLVVLADDAHLADGHSVWGLAPAGGATQRLPRLVGARRAAWLLFSGEPVTPPDALASGLVNAVVRADEVLTRARSMAATLARRSPASIASMKRAMREGLDAGSLEAGLEIERIALEEHMTSQDMRIGYQAFLSRSEPRFTGE